MFELKMPQLVDRVSDQIIVMSELMTRLKNEIKDNKYHH
jgi:hypothetical protein